MEHGVEQGHVGIGVELEVIRGVRARSPRPRSATISSRPAFAAFLINGRRNRMVHRRVGADDEDDFALAPSRPWFETVAELIPSISAATLEA